MSARSPLEAGALCGWVRRASVAAVGLWWSVACGDGETRSAPGDPAVTDQEGGSAGGDAATEALTDASTGGRSSSAGGGAPGSGNNQDATTPAGGTHSPDASLVDPDASSATDSGVETTDSGVEPQDPPAGTPDASSTLDASNGTPDPDASASDGGNPDPGVPDASVPDGGTATTPLPKNVIFLMADGYGPAQIEATRMFINGDTAPLNFETWPYQALVSTHNARNQITDSASAASAMATGHKVDPSVVSVAIPGDGADVKSAVEAQQQRGRRTGIVTTHTPVTDATPAAFASHAASRNNTTEIAATYFTETRPNVLFGLTAAGVTVPAAQAAGYTVVQNAAQLSALDLDSEEYVSGQFSEGTLPPLKDLALAALDILEDSPAGFFALIEQERTDTGGHANDLSEVLDGAVEFHEMVAAVLAWAEGRDDTLIVVGADHETGGLAVTESNPMQGVVPDHSYSTTGHSGVDVRFFATGAGADRVSGDLDNTDLFPIFAGYQSFKCSKSSACYAPTLDVVLRESNPNTAYASGASLEVDLDEGSFEEQSLLAFGDLTQYLPTGCVVQGAKLILHASNGSTNGIRLHRMLMNWSQVTTWNTFGGNGVQPNDSEAALTMDAETDALVVGINTFDVTSTVAAWLADPSANYGWVLLARGNDGADLAASEATLAPELRVYCE